MAVQLKLVAGANITLTVGTDTCGHPILTVASAAPSGSMAGYDTTDYAALANVPVPVAYSQMYTDANGTLWFCSKNTTVWVIIPQQVPGQPT